MNGPRPVSRAIDAVLAKLQKLPRLRDVGSTVPLQHTAPPSQTTPEERARWAGSP